MPEAPALPVLRQLLGDAVQLLATVHLVPDLAGADIELGQQLTVRLNIRSAASSITAWRSPRTASTAT